MGSLVVEAGVKLYFGCQISKGKTMINLGSLDALNEAIIASLDLPHVV